MNVILIGYMGSGKTTLGKKLAKRLGLEFIDTDKWIEENKKLSVSEIFAQYGETGFRNLEKELITQLSGQDNLLISTGGGMPCFNNLMDDLNKLGITIYLKRPAKELAKRVFNSTKKRPITDGKSEEELIVLIDKMLHERNVFYEQSHIIANREIQNVTTLEMMVKAYLRK